MLKAITIKTDEESVVLYNRLLGIRQQETPTLTSGAFFEELVNAYAKPKAEPIDITGYEREIAKLREELETERNTVNTFMEDGLSASEIRSKIIAILEIQDDDDALIDRITENNITAQVYTGFLKNLAERLNIEVSDGENLQEKIIAEIAATQQRAMSALLLPALKENEFLLTVPEPHLSLLIATSERLGKRAGVVISPQDILLDMFFRYTVERNSEWFYPFVIKGDDDFKAVSGYTQTQLKKAIWDKAEK